MFALGKIQKIQKILMEMAVKNEDFLIPDLTMIVASYVYEPPSECVKIINTQHNSVWIMKELKNGSIACGMGNGNIEIYSDVGREILSGHQQMVVAIKELKNGTIVSGSGDHTVKVWAKHKIASMPSRTCVHTLQHSNVPNFIYEYGNNCISCLSSDGQVKTWDTATGVCFKIINVLNNAFCFASCELCDGSVLVTSNKGHIYKWDVSFNKRYIKIKLPVIVEIIKVVELENGDIVVATVNNGIYVFDTSWAWIKIRETGTAFALISLDNNLITGTYGENSISQWRKKIDNCTWECVKTLETKKSKHLCISLRNTHIAYTVHTGNVEIIDINNTNTPKRILNCDTARIRTIIELKNGCIVTAPEITNSIKVWG